VANAQQPIELQEEPTDNAELRIRKTPEDVSFRATLPQRNAADLLPMTAVLGVNAGPTTMILYSGVELPWGALITIAIGQMLITGFILWMYLRRS
jgi:hypothetical protein